MSQPDITVLESKPDQVTSQQGIYKPIKACKNFAQPQQKLAHPNSV